MSDDLFDKGMAIRKAVLGADYVARAEANKTEFDEDWQRYVTEHAWAAVWIPDGGWLAVDPTNDQWVDERYVTVAWGRDYADVPPVKGVIFTEAKTSSLKVEVDVAPLDGP